MATMLLAAIVSSGCENRPYGESAVLDVIDGDRLRVRFDGERHEVAVMGLDCSAKRDEARTVAKRLIHETVLLETESGDWKSIRLTPDQDAYILYVRVGTLDYGAEMIRSGMCQPNDDILHRRYNVYRKLAKP